MMIGRLHFDTLALSVLARLWLGGLKPPPLASEVSPQTSRSQFRVAWFVMKEIHMFIRNLAGLQTITGSVPVSAA